MSTPDDQAPPAPSKSRKLLTIIAIVVGIVGGGGAGVFMAGPLMAGKLPAASTTAAHDGGGDSDGGHDEEAEEGGEHAEAPPVHLVENMVLNPAGSGGSRFLLLSVAFAVKDAAAAKTLADRDPELRDVILRNLGARAVEELADITQRDTIKAHLRAAVQERFGKEAVLEIFFPQFVIQ